ncbi:MAG: hypothetical protein ACSHW0_16175 [Thalassotalea sp.]
MRRQASMEAWLFILILIAIIVGIFLIGLVAVKLYRKSKPFKEESSDNLSISISHTIPSDGFFKIYFVGLLITSPVLYYLYEAM